VAGHGDRVDGSGAPSERADATAFGTASEVDIAWAAGLFEGEGSLSIARRRERGYPLFRVSSNDKDVLERFAAIIGCGHVRTRQKPAKAQHKQQYEFTLTRQQQARDAFYAMYPWLGERRRTRGLEVLAECAKLRDAANRRTTHR
jgi:hypothetical protein